MKHLIKTAALMAALSALPGAAWSSASVGVETFDNVAPRDIVAGESYALDYFTVTPGGGGTASIKSAAWPDLTGARQVLGSPKGASAIPIDLTFGQELDAVTLTLVMPAGDPSDVSSLSLHGVDGSLRTTSSFEHGLVAKRIRITLSGPTGTTFRRLALQLGEGAYVDDIDMASPDAASVVTENFDSMPSQSVAEGGMVNLTSLVLLSSARGVVIERNAALGSQGLTSTSPIGNDVNILSTRAGGRKSIAVTVIPDQAGEPATIEFLDYGTFSAIHKEVVAQTGGARRIEYSVANGNTLLGGIRWTGGKLVIDDIVMK